MVIRKVQSHVPGFMMADWRGDLWIEEVYCVVDDQARDAARKRIPLPCIGSASSPHGDASLNVSTIDITALCMLHPFDP
jgi:hypothetical protein